MITQENSFCTGDSAFAVNRSGRIVAWNKAASQSFGYSNSQALGQRCWELLSGRDVFGNRFCSEGCPILASAFRNEPINHFQIDFRTATHENLKCSVSALTLFRLPHQGVLIHLCQSKSDIDNSMVTKHASLAHMHQTLTARETETLCLLHRGMTIAEIAAAMGISASTVRNHTQHILLKLQVHSRFEAVALGRKLGLI